MIAKIESFFNIDINKIKRIIIGKKIFSNELKVLNSLIIALNIFI